MQHSPKVWAPECPGCEIHQASPFLDSMPTSKEAYKHYTLFTENTGSPLTSHFVLVPRCALANSTPRSLLCTVQFWPLTGTNQSLYTDHLSCADKL